MSRAETILQICSLLEIATDRDIDVVYAFCCGLLEDEQ